MKPTSQLLVFPGQRVPLFPGLLEFVHGALQFLLLVAQVPLRGFANLDGFFESGLGFDVDPFELIYSLLELPSSSVGLLQVDDEDFNFGLKTRFLFLQVVDLKQTTRKVIEMQWHATETGMNDGTIVYYSISRKS